MFDMSFLELVVIGVVGLLVLGPERLPGAIRTVSLYVGRMKRGFNKLRFEIEDEINASEEKIKLKSDAISRIDEDLAALKKNITSTINDANTSEEQRNTPIETNDGGEDTLSTHSHDKQSLAIDAHNS
ncbi:Sec-independent protein translocase protein TatB [Zhongshania sp. BJYM1]|jgi:sec-independent protein translocase protein TatB|uniref:Sec-independent protein translocase protein TatB n=1 Tax=Zhongshania aquatica TaxID=2965069 RepID=UPI0022B52095|nr:Sec-independent protein translocase protein TatB [Marortus sp. BJYM1]|tara:strand:+ start:37 stop:420 length:384 start_codon:yes stop_codon:yes gene_type:complete